jgi:uncharacterized protein
VRVEVVGSGTVLAERVRPVSTAVGRMRGLLGRGPLERGEALMLEPAYQVHTFGMRYRIDVVFCAADGRVLHVVRAMRPRRVSRWVRGARRALEFPSGSVPNEVVPGSKLAFYEGFSNGQ